MVLKINNTKINLGDLPKGTIKQFSLDIENVTSNPVSVIADASCGCTKPTMTKNPIPANETVQLMARFDTTGKSGLQSKSLYIDYMEGNNSQRVVIPFTANVI